MSEQRISEWAVENNGDGWEFTFGCHESEGLYDTRDQAVEALVNLLARDHYAGIAQSDEQEDDLREQLAAERAARQAAEQERDEATDDRDEYKLVVKSATEYAEKCLVQRDAAIADRDHQVRVAVEMQESADAALAQLEARDQQIAALREAGDDAVQLLRQWFAPPPQSRAPMLGQLEDAIRAWDRALLAPPAEGGAGDHPYMECAPGSCATPVPFVSEDHGGCHWPYGNGPYTGGPFCAVAESDHRGVSDE